MEQTFMTIHNLGPDANILFASASITDILGYQPSEVQGKSCFDYFHPDEVPSARSVHSRGVLLDKAAVLHYVRILARNGRWVGCECCFTIVHDVLVACTSIYSRNAKSERRAIEAPHIRRLFSCSPRDPRYHMLEHLSPKFKMPPTEREPRAALILNRFTRNLTVLFATTAITSVIGLRPGEIRNKSFYRCIQESCLPEAIKCLESAKANDSIAYLRFWFQDPREDDELLDDPSDGRQEEDEEEDEEGEEEEEVEEEYGGAEDQDMPLVGSRERRYKRPRFDNTAMAERAERVGRTTDTVMDDSSPVLIKAEEDDEAAAAAAAALPEAPYALHSATVMGTIRRPGVRPRLPSIELEAVVSCTSDGLVVILRKARPPIPPAHPPLVSFGYGDGLFAAPWGQHPIRPHFPHESLHTFRPPLLPQYMPLRENVKAAGGPPLDVLMGSIRDVAVFAWGVVGINPAMAAYGRGLPSGEARPASSGPRQSHQRGANTDANAGANAAAVAATVPYCASASRRNTSPGEGLCFPPTVPGKDAAPSTRETLHSFSSPALPPNDSHNVFRSRPKAAALRSCSIQSSLAEHSWGSDDWLNAAPLPRPEHTQSTPREVQTYAAQPASNASLPVPAPQHPPHFRGTVEASHQPRLPE